MANATFEDHPTDPEKVVLRKPRLDQGPDYERGFVDGMQYQMQSSVDKAVNRMAQQEPVAYTGNGTAGREADVRPTGFFFQADKRQPEQKPVGEVYGWHGVGVGQPLCRFNVTESDMPVGSLLYTTPPQRTWVGLTDEEMVALCQNGFGIDPVLDGNLRKYAKAIEAKLKEKNT